MIGRSSRSSRSGQLHQSLAACRGFADATGLSPFSRQVVNVACHSYYLCFPAQFVTAQRALLCSLGDLPRCSASRCQPTKTHIYQVLIGFMTRQQTAKISVGDQLRKACVKKERVRMTLHRLVNMAAMRIIKMAESATTGG